MTIRPATSCPNQKCHISGYLWQMTRYHGKARERNINDPVTEKTLRHGAPSVLRVINLYAIKDMMGIAIPGGPFVMNAPAMAI